MRESNPYIYHVTVSSFTRKWCLKGHSEKISSPAGRKSIRLSGYVIASTGELVVNESEWFTYEDVINSLRSFIEKKPLENGKKYVMVLDNAPWHKKALRLINENAEKQYDDILNAMTLISLPTYSPDLNPIEQVWRIVRREVTHNKFF